MRPRRHFIRRANFSRQEKESEGGIYIIYKASESVTRLTLLFAVPGQKFAAHWVLLKSAVSTDDVDYSPSIFFLLRLSLSGE